MSISTLHKGDDDDEDDDDDNNNNNKFFFADWIRYRGKEQQT